nr:Transposase, Tc1-like protein [Ipomoea batatas]
MAIGISGATMTQLLAQDLMYEDILIVNGKVKYGSIKDVANVYSVSTRTVSRIWKKWIACVANGVPVDISLNLSGNVGRKRIAINPEDVARIPLNRRTTIRSMASALSITSQKYYLLPEEDEPYRTCKSKKFITKVMFLCDVARPRFDLERNEMFDGKIGMFPFVYKEPAKRRSKNREAGTLETKPIESVNKEVTRTWLIDYVLLAIRAKWPPSSSKTIYIQQDNARRHISMNDVEVLEAAKKDGFDIHLTCQPPNSPDMNVSDLDFFRALQSLQHQEAPRNVDELVAATHKAFNEISVESLSNVFLTLQLCMVEVMKKYGGNNYKLPHINKQMLAREGLLPSTISCDPEVLVEAISSLQQ